MCAFENFILKRGSVPQGTKMFKKPLSCLQVVMIKQGNPVSLTLSRDVNNNTLTVLNNIMLCPTPGP